MISICEEKQTVSVNGRRLDDLTPLEWQLISALKGRDGDIVEKYDIVKSVWGEDYIDSVDDQRIEKLVSRLRSKIEVDPTNPKYILTVRGRGYRIETNIVSDVVGELTDQEKVLLTFFGQMDSRQRELLVKTAQSWV